MPNPDNMGLWQVGQRMLQEMQTANNNTMQQRITDSVQMAAVIAVSQNYGVMKKMIFEPLLDMKGDADMIQVLYREKFSAILLFDFN